MNDLIFKPKIPKVYNPIWLENPLKIITEEEKKIRIQRLLRGFDDGPVYQED